MTAVVGWEIVNGDQDDVDPPVDEIPDPWDKLGNVRGPEGPPGPPGPEGPPGMVVGGASPAYVDDSIAAHVNAPEPHPAYDDLPDFVLLFENGLI